MVHPPIYGFQPFTPDRLTLVRDRREELFRVLATQPKQRSSRPRKEEPTLFGMVDETTREALRKVARVCGTTQSSKSSPG